MCEFAFCCATEKYVTERNVYFQVSEIEGILQTTLRNRTLWVITTTILYRQDRNCANTFVFITTNLYIMWQQNPTGCGCNDSYGVSDHM